MSIRMVGSAITMDGVRAHCLDILSVIARVGGRSSIPEAVP
jgi:hypothetical protein